MLKHQVEPRSQNLVRVIINIHALPRESGKALVSLHICAGSSEPSVLNNVISTKILRAGLNSMGHHCKHLNKKVSMSTK